MTNAPYAGDLTPDQAWKILQEDKSAVLVDVRTDIEFTQIGIPDVSNLEKQTQLISWKLAPSMNINMKFIEQVQALGSDSEAPLVFICRSGVRSIDAAVMATSHGFSKCYNVLGGFEGSTSGPITTAVDGWRAAELPWGFPKS